MPQSISDYDRKSEAVVGTYSPMGYTFRQPNNLDAYRLGEACHKASQASAGDYIDRGLLLMRELEALGYGVVKLPNFRDINLLG